VKGAFAGTWYHGYRNEFLRWFEQDIDIAPELTRGKTQLEIRLEVPGDERAVNYTDFNYSVYSLIR
jgi:hypothetical protein